MAVSIVLFFLTVVEHMFWCRLKHKDTLNTLSFGVIGVSNVMAYVFSVFLAFKNSSGNFASEPFIITSVVFYIFLSGIYLALYYGVNIDSPTRSVIRLVKQKEKISDEELIKHFANNNFVLSRLKALVEHAFVVFDGARYRLANPGIKAAKTLALYEKFYGRHRGG